jgi:16S rRNA (cytosine967-C5)-methyltransferase
MTGVDPSRETAFALLRAVREDGAYANLAMPQLLRARKLTGRDAGFATELGYGTLRWQGWYDVILQSCITRSWASVEAGLKDVLRLGCHQLLAMRVPSHAAVDSSCELARRNGNPGSATGRAGFVNAVLRKVAARSPEEWVEYLDVAGDDVTSLATRMSHPAWIIRAFQDALGDRRDEVEFLLEADNEPARPTLVARPGRLSAEELRALPQVEPTRWSPLGAVLVDGTPESLNVVQSGLAGVQDEGSQLMALALAIAVVDHPEHAWLDMCAGPGGKAALLAGFAAQRGVELVAVEQHHHRAVLVDQAVGRAAHVEVLVGDATSAPWGIQRFDRVLVDAPCTGLGALRRRPEARWRKSPMDLATLGPLQRALLNSAADATLPGGVIAYVTCSPHLAETEFVVGDVVDARDDLLIEDARPLLPGVEDLGDGPFVRLWPHRHGTDGMFLAVLRKG